MPAGCCKDIDSMLARFWWGSNEEHKKIHWMSWERLSKAKNDGGMGFRGMGEFNTALLGKHCWRLATGDTSLLEKVFKSRYYPNGDFMTAKEGYQPSYSWRSIVSARTVVESGGIWKIGNGRYVRIWKDKWIHDMKHIKSRNPNCSLSEDGLVSELIDEDTRQWKRDLIFSCFNCEDAQKIINTPLSSRLPSDSLIWYWEKDGLYSVRSAYHLLCEEKSRLQPGPSCPRKSKLWKEIWRAPVPNKVKNFMWRLAKDILPTRSNIQKKGITLDVECPLCHMGVESSTHLFMECPLMKLTLFTSHLGSHIPHSVDLHDWILSWLTCGDSIGTQLFCILLWKFWDCRNNVVFRGMQVDPTSLAAYAMQFVNEYNEANPPKNAQVALLPSVVHAISTPPSFNIFVDAGCSMNGSTGWGLVIHNQLGETIFSACKKENISMELAMAEALGIRLALQTAIEHDLPSFSVYSDAANVVNCITKKTTYASIEIIAQDCRELMSGLSNASVLFVRREQNIEAHNLASMAKHVGNGSWLGVAPPVSISSVVAAMPAVICNQNGCISALL